jgi:hypothetical protein
VTDVTPKLTSLPLESLIVQCLSLNGQLSCYRVPCVSATASVALMLNVLHARLIKEEFHSTIGHFSVDI